MTIKHRLLLEHVTVLDSLPPEDDFIECGQRIHLMSQNLKILGPVCVEIRLDHLIHQVFGIPFQ